MGVDGASQTHHAFVIDARSRKRGFAHGGEGPAEMAVWTSDQTGGTPDAASVAIEALAAHGDL